MIPITTAYTQYPETIKPAKIPNRKTNENIFSIFDSPFKLSQIFLNRLI